VLPRSGSGVGTAVDWRGRACCGLPALAWNGQPMAEFAAIGMDRLPDIAPDGGRVLVLANLAIHWPILASHGKFDRLAAWRAQLLRQVITSAGFEGRGGRNRSKYCRE